MLGVKLPSFWYKKSRYHPLTFCLIPFSWLFAVLIRFRKWCYASGICKQYQADVPVIVVGNITLGGTGKTPFVIWLSQFLTNKGYKVGLISRGYGGKQHVKPFWADLKHSAHQIGDEALVLLRNTACPLVLAKNKGLALNALLAKEQCDVVISDDGLQHYALARDIEIALIDATREFGNGHLLPAGPLREPITRLKQVDFVITNDGFNSSSYSTSTTSMHQEMQVSMQAVALVSVKDPSNQIAIHSLRNQTVHAVTAIANPQRFFAHLRQLGIQVIEHIFYDHYIFKAQDFQWMNDLPIVMTEKDAVKCAGIIGNRDAWYLQSKLKMSDDLQNRLYFKINSVLETKAKRRNELC